MFTRALVELLPSGSHVTAIDRQKQDLRIAEAEFILSDLSRKLLSIVSHMAPAGCIVHWLGLRTG